MLIRSLNGKQVIKLSEIIKNQIQDHLVIYKNIFENLSIDELDLLKNVTSEEIIFIDPFNHVKGQQKFIMIFFEMFNRVKNPKFVVSDYSVSICNLDRRIGYMNWNFSGEFKSNNKQFIIRGMSEIQFDVNGRIIKHEDHWDSLSQLIFKLPKVGFIIKWFFKLFS